MTDRCPQTRLVGDNLHSRCTLHEGHVGDHLWPAPMSDTTRAMPCGCEPYTGTVCQSHYQPLPAPEPGGAAPLAQEAEHYLAISDCLSCGGHDLVSRLLAALAPPDLAPLEALAARFETDGEVWLRGLGDNIRTRICREHAAELRAVLAQMKGQS